MRPILALPLLALAACTEFPELDAAVPRSVLEGPYPRLLPMEELLAGPAPTVSPAAVRGIEGRVAALRARAARLKGPVIDGETEARMRRGVEVEDG